MIWSSGPSQATNAVSVRSVWPQANGTIQWIVPSDEPSGRVSGPPKADEMVYKTISSDGNRLALRSAEGIAMSVYDFTAIRLDGSEQKLSDYRGQVLLIVNTASECG